MRSPAFLDGQRSKLRPLPVQIDDWLAQHRRKDSDSRMPCNYQIRACYNAGCVYMPWNKKNMPAIIGIQNFLLKLSIDLRMQRNANMKMVDILDGLGEFSEIFRVTLSIA